MSDDECKQFMEITEIMGFDLAKISTGSGMKTNTDVRNNKRVIWHTEKGIFYYLIIIIMSVREKKIGKKLYY